MGCIDPPCGKLLMEEEEGRLFFHFFPLSFPKSPPWMLSPHTNTFGAPLSAALFAQVSPNPPGGWRRLAQGSGGAEWPSSPLPCFMGPPHAPHVHLLPGLSPKAAFQPKGGGLRCCLWVGDCQAGPSPREVRGGRVVFLPS